MQSHRFVQQASNVTELGWDLLLELLQHMDPKDKSRWRLVNKAASAAVYEGCRALSPSSTAVTTLLTMTALPLPLLTKCRGLKQLSCRGLRSLTSIHGLPSGLELLDISRTAVADLSPLQHCTSLRQLSADALDLPFSQAWTAFRQLPSTFKHLTALQQLSFAANKMGGWGARAVAPAIQQLTALRQLNLAENRLGAEGVTALAPAIQKLTGLQQLDLGSNWLDAKGVLELAPALLQLTGLQQLHLNHNSLCAAGAQALAPALQQLTGLQQLDISNNRLSAEGVGALALAIQQLTGLQQLRLNQNDMRGGGAAALVPAIRQLTSLQQLDLSCNKLGDEGVQALAHVFTQQHTALRRLDVRSNDVGDEGARALARVVSRLPALAVLCAPAVLQLSFGSSNSGGDTDDVSDTHSDAATGPANNNDNNGNGDE